MRLFFFYFIYRQLRVNCCWCQFFSFQVTAFAQSLMNFAPLSAVTAVAFIANFFAESVDYPTKTRIVIYPSSFRHLSCWFFYLLPLWLKNFCFVFFFFKIIYYLLIFCCCLLLFSMPRALLSHFVDLPFEQNHLVCRLHLIIVFSYLCYFINFLST